jgi:peptide/nickel transport system permease protein
MATQDTIPIDSEPIVTDRRPAFFRLLVRDPFVFLAVCWLILIFVAAVIGPELLGDAATKLNLRARNTPPGTIEKGWLTVLGTDSLGRSMLARLVVATRNTLAVAVSAAVLSMVMGGILGLFAGYVGRWPGNIIMRFSDVLQSFPSLLLAVIVLYILEPRVFNIIIVLSITRLPIYIRVARAEVLEIRERLFVDAARVLGSSPARVVFRHVAPVVAPTIFTILTVDFAFVMLAESGLSFLGIGIQPPSITWGLMVAQGRNYLNLAWWLAFLPGMMIMLSTLSANILSNWLRMAADPVQRWRLEMKLSQTKDE